MSDRPRLAELVARSSVISRDGYGEKVLLTPEGTMVKIFRRKRLISSALFCSTARRFQRNAERLTRVGIATIKVIDLTYCRESRKHLVTYEPLAGISMREAVTADEAPAVLSLLARFVANLHQMGIYFRSIHFGNIVVTPSGELGLIDVADMRFSSSSLSADKRERNFRHMLRYAEDRETLQQFGPDLFLKEYLSAASLPPAVADRLKQCFFGHFR